MVKELLISRCEHLYLILDKDNYRLKEKEFNQKWKFFHNLLTFNLFQTHLQSRLLFFMYMLQLTGIKDVYKKMQIDL